MLDNQTAIHRLKTLDRDLVWHGFTQMAEYEPLVIAKAEGNWLYTIDGQKLFDGVSSLWCNVHGHQHPHINAAIEGQLKRVGHVTGLGMSNIPAIELAAELVRRAPIGLKHVYYSSDGSSAVEAALKMALQYARQTSNLRGKKDTYIALGDAYHGDTIGGVSLGGIASFHQLFQPLLFQPLRAPCPNMYRLPTGVTEATALGYYLREMELLLAANHESVIAVVMEPLVQGAAGMIVHPKGYLQGVRELTNRYGVLLICDEVATGFGRTGTLFACEQEQVVPDILCLAKGLTGGYLPMAVTLANDRVYDAFLAPLAAQKQFFHGHTYSGNALAAAAAIASLQIFDEEQTLTHVRSLIETLKTRLRSLADHPHVGDIRQCGLMVGIELVADRDRKQSFPYAELKGRKFCQRAIERGVWLRPLGDVIVLMPPLSTRPDELHFVMDTIEACLE